MQEITVSKERLINCLKTNLASHKEEFKNAHNAWRVEAIAYHNARIEAIENGAIGTATKDKLEPAEPASYEKNYAQALEMLEMEVADVVTINKAEFRQFVQDEWDFSAHFKNQVTAYTGKKFTNY